MQLLKFNIVFSHCYRVTFSSEFSSPVENNSTVYKLLHVKPVLKIS